MNPNIFHDRDFRDWCNSLGNTSWQAVWNLRLLLLLIASSIFKIYRIVKYGATSGLAFSHLFLGTLFNISQLCIGMTSSVVRFPGLDCLRYAASLGFGALNPVFLLLVSAIVFACALTIYSLNYVGVGSLHENTICMAAEVHPTRANRTMMAIDKASSQTPFNCLIGVYIMALFLPNIIFLIIAKDSSSWKLAIYLYYPFFYFHLVTLPVLAFGQFIPEITFLWRKRDMINDIYLDVPAFAVDSVPFSLIGTSWRLFLASQDPLLLNIGYVLAHPLSFQMFAALMWLDYIVLGLGQGVVLAFYLWLGRRNSARLADERKADLEEEYCCSGSANERTSLLAEHDLPQ